MPALCAALSHLLEYLVIGVVVISMIPAFLPLLRRIGSKAPHGGGVSARLFRR
jgi:hypothetical protein